MDRKHTPGCKCCSCSRLIGDLVITLTRDGTPTTHTLAVDQPMRADFYKAWQIGCVGPVTRSIVNPSAPPPCVTSINAFLRDFSFSLDFPSANTTNSAATLEFTQMIPKGMVEKTITGASDRYQTYDWLDERFVPNTLACKYKNVAFNFDLQLNLGGVCRTATAIAASMQATLRGLNSPPGRFPELADVVVAVSIPDQTESRCDAQYVSARTYSVPTLSACLSRTDTTTVWGYLIELFAETPYNLKLTVTRYARQSSTRSDGLSIPTVNTAIQIGSQIIGSCYARDPYAAILGSPTDQCSGFCDQVCFAAYTPILRTCDVDGVERETITAQLTWDSGPSYGTCLPANVDSLPPSLGPMNIQKVIITVGSKVYTLDATATDDPFTVNLPLGSNWPPSSRTRKMRSGTLFPYCLDQQNGTMLWQTQDLTSLGRPGTIRYHTTVYPNQSYWSFGGNIYPSGLLAQSAQEVDLELGGVYSGGGFGTTFYTQIRPFLQVFHAGIGCRVEFEVDEAGITCVLRPWIFCQVFYVRRDDFLLSFPNTFCADEITADKPYNPIEGLSGLTRTWSYDWLTFTPGLTPASFPVDETSDVYVEQTLGDFEWPTSHGVASYGAFESLAGLPYYTDPRPPVSDITMKVRLSN